MTTSDAALTSSALTMLLLQLLLFAVPNTAEHGSNVATALQHGKEYELNLIEDARWVKLQTGNWDGLLLAPACSAKLLNPGRFPCFAKLCSTCVLHRRPGPDV